MSAPLLSLVPPLEPPPPLEGQPLEDAARAALCSMLNLVVTVTAPTWRQVLFSGRRDKFAMPKIPDASLERMGRITPPESLPKDNVGITALGLAEALQQSRPEGFTPASITAVPTLKPSRDSVASWLRRVFLVTTGPAAIPLLVGAGYLLPGDVDILAAAYPEGMEAQRKAAVEAGMAVTSAGHRGGHGVELPPWLNDQLMTLMAEPRDVGFFQGLYADKGREPAGPGSLGGKAGRLAQQIAPDTVRKESLV